MFLRVRGEGSGGGKLYYYRRGGGGGGGRGRGEKQLQFFQPVSEKFGDIPFLDLFLNVLDVSISFQKFESFNFIDKERGRKEEEDERYLLEKTIQRRE